MRESETYMGILEEGAIEHAKKMIVRLGKASIGPPDESVTARLTALGTAEELDRLDRMIEKKFTKSKLGRNCSKPIESRPCKTGLNKTNPASLHARYLHHRFKAFTNHFATSIAGHGSREFPILPHPSHKPLEAVSCSR